MRGSQDCTFPCRSSPDPGEHLAILIEGKQLLGTRVVDAWERLRAVDLDSDHVSEIVTWSRDTKTAGGGSWLEVVSYAGGSEHSLGWFSSSDETCGQAFHLSYGRDRTDHGPCFLAEYPEIPCPPLR